MKNSEVERALDECERDITQVRNLLRGLGVRSNLTPYLTKYSIIKSCGSVEVAYKNIIADYCSHRSKPQVKFYINKTIRKYSSNPSYENIINMLNRFDKTWVTNFTRNVNLDPDKDKIITSLKSLVDARNEFAHGGDPGASIDNVVEYFLHSRKIVSILDSVINI